jgi:type VI secretion system protein ImpA
MTEHASALPIELQALLAPRHPDNPAGEDLTYRPDFIELMQRAAGTPEVEYGTMRVAAAEPPWVDIETQALQLLGESRDLRLAILLARARLARHGLAGFAGALGLISELIRLDWQELHPRLDPEDNLDPTERLNILAELNAPAFLVRLGEAPVIELPLLGTLGLAIFQPRQQEGQNGDGLSAESIAAALHNADPAGLAHAGQTVTDCLARVQSIESTLHERTGLVGSLSLAALADVLQPALTCLRQETGTETFAPTAGHAAATGGPLPTAEISSRADIARLLDLICDYYRRQEPASPVPILLQRARRLLEMDFLEVMADLAPGALPDIRILSGPIDD